MEIERGAEVRRLCISLAGWEGRGSCGLGCADVVPSETDREPIAGG